jgi:hypothetical protein
MARPQALDYSALLDETAIRAHYGQLKHAGHSSSTPASSVTEEVGDEQCNEVDYDQSMEVGVAAAATSITQDEIRMTNAWRNFVHMLMTEWCDAIAKEVRRRANTRKLSAGVDVRL